MSNILVTLLGGLLLIIVSFVSLYRLSKMSGKMVAIIMAFLVTGIYVPISIFIWPGADVFAIHIAVYLVSVYVLGIITSQRDDRRKDGKTGLGFHWAPATIVTFFVLLLIVDSFFIMFATQGMNSTFAKWFLPEPALGGKVSSHFPGVVSHDYHEKQDQYNEYLKRFEIQQLRNWTIRKGWIGNVTFNKPAIFRVEINSKNNKPVTAAKVEATFLRPANSKLDKKYKMQEVEPGIYQQSIKLSEPGNWELILKIEKGEAQHEVRAKTLIN